MSPSEAPRPSQVYSAGRNSVKEHLRSLRVEIADFRDVEFGELYLHTPSYEVVTHSPGNRDPFTGATTHRIILQETA